MYRLREIGPQLLEKKKKEVVLYIFDIMFFYQVKLTHASLWRTLQWNMYIVQGFLIWKPQDILT